MKLLTKAIENQLPKLYSTDGKNYVPVIVKFFCPWNQWTWYAVEGERQEDGDWLFFGLVEGHEKELGYFTLNEFKTVRGPAGLGIERDMYFDGYVLDKKANKVISARQIPPSPTSAA